MVSIIKQHRQFKSDVFSCCFSNVPHEDIEYFRILICMSSIGFGNSWTAKDKLGHWVRSSWVRHVTSRPSQVGYKWSTDPEILIFWPDRTDWWKLANYALSPAGWISNLCLCLLSLSIVFSQGLDSILSIYIFDSKGRVHRKTKLS